MKVGIMLYDVQDFGGLEEYAVGLAGGLRAQGEQVSFLSAAWALPYNQYVRRLAENCIPLFQPSAWISRLASDWPTKEAALRAVMVFLSPLTLILGVGVSLIKRRPVRRGLTSAYNWLKGYLMDGLIGRDYRRPLAILLLTWWMWRWRPDILHIQGYTTSLLFAIEWAHRHHLPVVYEEHQTPDPQFNWWKGFDASINKADRVIAVSEKSAESLREICGVTRPIRVRAPLLSDPYHPGWSKEIRGFDPARPFIVTTVARLYVTKGLGYLLEAAAIVVRRFPNIEFRVYGDGELKDQLLHRAGQLGLNGERIFRGIFTNREHLTRIMDETDIFLLSSVLEGQPLVIAEAMAFGCPIVSTRVGGIPELIQDGVNGLLSPPEAPECLAEKVMLLVDDLEMRQRLSRAARSSFENGPFQPQALGHHLGSIYREVLKEDALRSRWA